LLQATLQLAALPVSESIVQAFPSLQLVGQGDAVPASHVSPASMALFPHLGEQSLSLLRLQPLGQHPSLFVHWLMFWWPHATLQLAALPVSESIVQAFPSLQFVGQELGGSQVSGAVTTRSPQARGQSGSLPISQPAGQQPSPLWHWVTVW
jgi:hypothetical protein